MCHHHSASSGKGMKVLECGYEFDHMMCGGCFEAYLHACGGSKQIDTVCPLCRPRLGAQVS